jgi:nucleoside-diphosphate-sugar epimerase
MSDAEILVTGGAGILGSKVVGRLRSASIEPGVLSHSNRPGTIRGDLLTGEGLEAAVGGVDTIVHCASSPFRKAHRRTWRGRSACPRSPPRRGSRMSSTSPSSA